MKESNAGFTIRSTGRDGLRVFEYINVDSRAEDRGSTVPQSYRASNSTKARIIKHILGCILPPRSRGRGEFGSADTRMTHYWRSPTGDGSFRPAHDGAFSEARGPQGKNQSGRLCGRHFSTVHRVDGQLYTISPRRWATS